MHGLALLFEIEKGKDFGICQLPDSIREKREKKEKRAAKSGEKPKDKLTPEEKALKDAMRPKFGKSLGKAAVAQRLAASPKSASLRKTSKNNPINKGKRVATRNKPKGE